MNQNKKSLIVHLAKFHNISTRKLFSKNVRQLQREVSCAHILDNTGYDNFIFFNDSDYPEKLKEIFDPPRLIEFIGNKELLYSSKIISVVGTRDCTKYGLAATREICQELVANGFTLVSGMAFGIDTVAHQVALENNGKTIAVLGTSVNHPYPVANTGLYSKIKSQGLLISENITGEMQKWVFPRRNRIIAGLSMATLVIEAPEKSGALITARLAFDNNRGVYAVPGNIYTQNSKGCNRLLKIGIAQLVEKAEDIITDLNYTYIDSKDNNFFHFSDIERELLTAIASGNNSIETLHTLNTSSQNQVATTLSKLELKQIVAKDAFGNYTLLSNFA